MPQVILPKGWTRPRGYSHGMAGAGRLLAVAGQIGSRPHESELPRGLLPQFSNALENVVDVVRAAGGTPSDVISMTIYVTDQRQYHGSGKEIGAAWRARFGPHYPAMTLVEVKALMEPQAEVEIQALAVIPVP